ncbi:hypothetical protein F9C07_8719 [Aspergillus flavus]|uniref:Uncharacterized protein n=1 Tax=Aspergillus flavus (strain ATCC 200026 / FGSC A1120 / IAM 13836 / NRRL 3357 / JCM 12722 / SRRC 167) TaxID=332952 RepID=A0A7U2QVJ5_ASPFN|nr:hypothetical protein F9C07_8719 [Aspergillus flavus]
MSDKLIAYRAEMSGESYSLKILDSSITRRGVKGFIGVFNHSLVLYVAINSRTILYPARNIY